MSEVNINKVKKMQIKWIEFENVKTGLKIERIEFNRDITLLVGLSGVGKTQILEAVEYSLRLAIGKNVKLKMYRANVGIAIDNDIYEWEYVIDSNQDKELIGEEGADYYFSKERLLRNGQVLFDRNENEIFVIGYDKIPTPKRDESLLVQYAEDSSFIGITHDLKKLYPIEMDLDVRLGIGKERFTNLKKRVKEILSQDNSIDFKIFSYLPVALKLYVVKEYYSDLYQTILESVKELFDEIEDIDVVEDSAKELYLIAIKVYGKELLQHEISSGMLKTIYYIVELYTMPENSIILIEEFENGLGVNCIDTLTEMLLSEREDLQFIITSHHPKVIGGIDMNKWKIIDREISTIKNSDYKMYGIANSQHDAYFNLINRWEFEGKV